MLQKSFWGVEQNSWSKLIPFARGDVTDHINSFRMDSRTSVVALQVDAATEKPGRPGRSASILLLAYFGL